jgi:hypothetical protein
MEWGEDKILRFQLEQLNTLCSGPATDTISCARETLGSGEGILIRPVLSAEYIEEKRAALKVNFPSFLSLLSGKTCHNIRADGRRE